MVEQGVAVKYLKLGVFHAMQQHIHAGQVVGSDVVFLPVDFTHAPAGIFDALPYIKEQGA